MAVSTSYIGTKQAGNGFNPVFSFFFKIQAATDLRVYKIAANGTISNALVINVDYTVTFDPIAETGTVTYTVPPVSLGYSLIFRASAQNQGSVYPREAVTPAKVTENALDKLTLLVQELFRSLTLVPSYKSTSINPPGLIITTPVTGKALKYLDNGDGTFSINPSTYDPDTQVTAATVQAAAAAISAAAAAASAAAAAASAASLAADTLSGLFAARPAAPATRTFYYSTDRDSLDLWIPAAARWFTIG